MARRMLWLALVLLLPLPFVLTEIGWVPAARLLVLGGVTSAVWFVEGEFLAGLIGGILLVQATFQVLLCRWVAERLLRRVADASRPLTVALLVIVLLVAAQWPIYRTPLSAQSPRATVWQVFD